METFGDGIKQKLSNKYRCDICDYTTCRKSNLTNHYNSIKHKNAVAGDIGDKNKQILSKIKQNSNKLICQNCNKLYMSRNGLWKHKAKGCNGYNCTDADDSDEDNIKLSDVPTDKELILMLIKENSEFKNMMIKVLENGTTNTNNNHSHNTTNTNSHNKAFNLQFFLNETCKDAMNISEFVDSIQFQLSDLERVGEIGYVEGISNIIVKNLNKLDITKRPVHCTDKKRETMYIKDENIWEKDEEQKKLRKLIKKVADQNARLIPKFTEKYPGYKNYHSKDSDKYSKIIVESMGGSGNNDLEKEDKIIRNIAKNVVVEKE